MGIPHWIGLLMVEFSGIPLLERTTQQNDKTANSKFCAEHEGLYLSVLL